MKLSENQITFSYNIACLTLYANSKGIGFTYGEAERTKEQQMLYFYGYTLAVVNGELKLVKTTKKSKTLNSNHLRRLAVDFNFFMDGKLLNDEKLLQDLGDYWCSLNPKNRWGGNWGWDKPHFEMNV